VTIATALVFKPWTSITRWTGAVAHSHRHWSMMKQLPPSSQG